MTAPRSGLKYRNHVASHVIGLVLAGHCNIIFLLDPPDPPTGKMEMGTYPGPQGMYPRTAYSETTTHVIRTAPESR
jgi:hypothetical protein